MSVAATGGNRAAASCRQCGSSLRGGGDFVSWCPHCNWNIDPGSAPAKTGPAGWWLAVQNGLALNLHRQVASRRASGPGGYALRAAVLLGASLVHLLTVALCVVGVIIALSASVFRSGSCWRWL